MKKKTKNKIIVLTLLLIVYLFGIYTQPDTKTENKEKFSTKERQTEVINETSNNLKVTYLDQTTPNMIQRISGVFERKPLISRGIIAFSKL